VVHSATFEANDSFGRFKVICDRVWSPNMRYPKIANEPYIAVQMAKLHNYSYIKKFKSLHNKTNPCKKVVIHTI
jgi:hypothetical protein